MNERCREKKAIKEKGEEYFQIRYSQVYYVIIINSTFLPNDYILCGLYILAKVINEFNNTGKSQQYLNGTDSL